MDKKEFRLAGTVEVSASAFVEAMSLEDARRMVDNDEVYSTDNTNIGMYANEWTNEEVDGEVKLTGIYGPDGEEWVSEEDPTSKAAKPDGTGLLEAQIDWLTSDDTGNSAMAIFRVMTSRAVQGNWSHGATPLDGDDFGRCHRLLELFPQWRIRIGEMANQDKRWAKFVLHWPTLTSIYVKADPEDKSEAVYDAIKSIRFHVE